MEAQELGKLLHAEAEKKLKKKQAELEAEIRNNPTLQAAKNVALAHKPVSSGGATEVIVLHDDAKLAKEKLRTLAKNLKPFDYGKSLLTWEAGGIPAQLWFKMARMASDESPLMLRNLISQNTSGPVLQGWEHHMCHLEQQRVPLTCELLKETFLQMVGARKKDTALDAFTDIMSGKVTQGTNDLTTHQLHFTCRCMIAGQGAAAWPRWWLSPLLGNCLWKPVCSTTGWQKEGLRGTWTNCRASGARI